jgi:glycosyltransferase involved in cell wall biosynthesis
MQGILPTHNPGDDPWAGVRQVVATSLYLRGLVDRGQAASLADLTDEEFRQAVEAFPALPELPSRLPVVSLSPYKLALPAAFKLSVLMPVYNERSTIMKILEQVRAVDLPKEVLVVDDGSTDGTREILRSEVDGKLPDVRVFYHEQNQGKGAAVRTAIAAASGSVSLIQDADLEYDPWEYFQLLEPILDGRADVVYGSRFIGGGPHRVHLFWHSLGNKLLTTLSNMLTNLNLTDMETCYKVVRTDLLQSLPLRANRFDLEPELTALLASVRARIYEVPISYSGRDYSEGKKIGWKDGVQAISCIVRCRLRASS